MLLLNATTVRNCEYALKSDKLLTPEEALKYNMIDDLVDSSSDLIPKVEEVMDMWLKVPDAAFQNTKISMRKSFVDHLISNEKQDLDDMVKNILNCETQNLIRKQTQQNEKVCQESTIYSGEQSDLFLLETKALLTRK
ncbi:enoyl-CoA delta isomerase 1, mitochondrial [Caerostris darwini]|uniref:Enoyl-CoA delta isomerase 1, mitochondrial n=1 Tax=Caerostris darwini TaxID=1538125 RepID=A0AAV4T8G9_9ARAC|nr:enoyl-CoA delta isomerase 1, mitochondrial [Caerostris darwini]